MFKPFNRRCNLEVTITLVEHSNGPPNIDIHFSNCAAELLEDTAKKRGMLIEEIVGEGLRLEKLLADGELYVHTLLGVERLTRA